MGIFQACDIRGIADTELTDDIVYKIALAIGTKLTGKKVVVGGDVRLSTPRLQQTLIEGLVYSGCQVMDIGTVATPVFYYALKSVGADGGVMVTASHNPAPYNGFKLVLGPQPVSEEDVAEIGRLVACGASIPGQGSVQKLEVVEDYISYIKDKAKPESLRVVVDAGNGATSLIAPKVFRAIGYDVVELYCQPDGAFPNRSPNPALAENLERLGDKVRSTGASLGVAFDGDGDRVAFVDENGRALDNDDIMVLLAKYYLKKQPGTIIYDAKCSLVVPEEVAAAGGRAIMARAGHTFSKAAFMRENALFAGEISGHFFFSELGNDDGMFGGIKLCEFVAEAGSLARLVDAIPSYLLTPDIRIPYHGGDKPEVLETIAQKLDAYQLNRIDGVRIEFADGWGMIRASVTEPLFTLRFEAKSAERMQQIMDILVSVLPEAISAAVQEKLRKLGYKI
ncbi:MAG: phosphomannomutase/phosphoglucomutase [Pelosinus sp.]|nr:phosphomannomutase/phosphoglucomutase [Pelosinus sp.]